MKNWTEDYKEVINYVKPDNYSKRYGYVPHNVFLEELKEKVDKKGLIIEKERYLGAMDNKVICGTYQLSNGDSEMKTTIGFINSVNGMRKASVWAQGLVLVCTNGMVRSLGSYNRKHIEDQAITDIRNNMTRIVDNAEEEFHILVKQREELKTREIDKKVISQLIGDMYINQSIINETQMAILKKQVNFSESFKTQDAWSFYNWTTESLKDNHPNNYDKSHIKFHSYMLDQFDIEGKSSLFDKVI